MAGALLELTGTRVWLVGETGPPLLGERDALDLIAEAYAADAALVAIPAARCGEAFFQLRTRVLGEIAQKLVNYGVRSAIVGDVSRHVAASEAFRDFVGEANRGRQICFVPSLDALAARLGEEGKSGP